MALHFRSKCIHILWILGLLLSSIAPARAASPRVASQPAPRATAAAAAAAQEITAIDPGPWNQLQPVGAADAAGNLYAVWMDDRDGEIFIRFAYRPLGHDWQPSVRLDPTGDQRQSAPQIAVDGSGNAYAVWVDKRDGHQQIYFAHRPVGGEWGASRVISATVQFQHAPRLAVNRRGQAVVAWLQGDKLWSWRHVFAAVRSADGQWSAAKEINDPGVDQSFYSLDAAMDNWGRAYLAWRALVRTDYKYRLFFASRPAGGPWTAPESILETTKHITAPRMAVDLAGNVHLLWGEFVHGDEADIYAAHRPLGGGWSAKVRVTDSGGELSAASIAVDGAGNVIAAWSSFANHGQVWTAIRPRGGDWGAPELLFDGPPTPATNAIPALAANMQPRKQDTWNPEYALAGGGFGGGKLDGFWLESRNDHYNVHQGSWLGIGGNGECQRWPATPAQSSALHPAQGQGGDLCHAGNGYEQPAEMWDLGLLEWDFFAYSAVSYPVRQIETGGQTVWVVDAPGHFGMFTNQGDAEAFAWQQAVMNPPEQPFGPPTPPPGFQIPEPSPQPTPQPGPTPVSGRDEDQPGPMWVRVYDANFNLLFEGWEEEAERWRQQHPLPESPRFPPEFERQQDALYLLDKVLYGWATEEEVLELNRLRNYLPVSPQMLIDVYERSQRIGGDLRVPSINLLAHASPQAIRELDRRLREEEARREAATAGSRNTAISSQPQYQEGYSNSLYNIQLNREELNRLLGQRLLDWYRNRSNRNGQTTVQQGQEALREGQQYLEQETEDIQAQTQSNTTPADAFAAGYQAKATDPVLPHSGEFVHTETLLHIPGRGVDYLFRLTYRSQLVYDGPVGWGWTHNYDQRLVDIGGGSLARRTGAGLTDIFPFDGAKFLPATGRYSAIVRDAAAITITHRGGLVETYFPLNHATAAGRLRSLADRNGNALTFGYDAQGRLATVTDSLGRVITYEYNEDGRIVAVIDFTGRRVALDYDERGDLVSVTTPAVTNTPNGNDFPQGKTTRFAYTSGFDDERLNHNLTTIIAPNEVADGSLTPRIINTYGAEGLEFDRVVRQSWGGGRSNANRVPAGGDVILEYSTAIAADDPPAAASKTTITDRGGHVIELWHDGAGHRLRSRRVVDGQALVTDYAYNADGQLTAVTFPAGNRIEYTYDRGAENRLAQGNLLEVRRIADPARGCDGLGAAPCPDLVITYTYEPTFQLLQSVTDPNGHTTTNAYDAHGNLIRVDFPDITVGPASPQSAFATWTYNQWGQPLTFTDPEGNVTAYAYYDAGPAKGYRKSITLDSGGLNLTTAYEYDAVGNITAITDPRGIRTEYVVNALNQVVQIIHSAQRDTQYAIRYWYDANNNLVRVDRENIAPALDADLHLAGTATRDAANPWLTATFAYDLLDNVITGTMEISSTAQAVFAYRYDPQENLVSITLPEGNRVEYAYDARRRLKTRTLGAGTPEAGVTTYSYDANGNLKRLINAENHATDYFYDGFDRWLGYVDALGNVSHWECDANGNVVETMFRDGQDGRNPTRSFAAPDAVMLNHAQYRYDERNRRYETRQRYFSADVDAGVITPITTDGDGDGWVKTNIAYDRNGNLTALIDDKGRATLFGYDGVNRLTTYTDALNNVTTFTYDGANNPVQITTRERQPDGLHADEVFTLTFSYDPLNRLVESTDNLGHAARFAYDSLDNRVYAEDALGNTTLYAYDGLGRLTRVTRHLRENGAGDGAVIAEATRGYAYDANGNITASADPNGNVTTYAYDALDRLITITYADGAAASFTYDRVGNPVRQTDANGNVFISTFDARNRRVQTDVNRAAGVTGTTRQTFAYDGLSRLVAATDNNDPDDPADDSALARTYDSLGHVLSETQGDVTVTATYDGLGNRLSLGHPGGPALTMTYDALNRLKTVSDGEGQLAAYDYIGPWRVLRRANANGTYAAYEYDRVRRLVGVGHRRQSDDALLMGFSVIRDAVGNILRETAQPGDVQTSYTYDSLYRLTRYERPGLTQTFAYDPTGNRTQETRNGQVIAYSVDARNRYTRIGGVNQTHDANGNLIWNGRRGYSYDAFDRLVASAPARKLHFPMVVRQATASAAAPAPASHPTTQPPTPAPALITHRYDALDRRVSKQAGEEMVRYLYDAGRVIAELDANGDRIVGYVGHLLMEREAARYYYQTDVQGSVRGLADENAAVVERVDYEAFGAPIFADGALSVPYLWRGLRYDADERLYALGGQRYDPEIGRGLQP